MRHGPLAVWIPLAWWHLDDMKRGQSYILRCYPSSTLTPTGIFHPHPPDSLLHLRHFSIPPFSPFWWSSLTSSSIAGDPEFVFSAPPSTPTLLLYALYSAQIMSDVSKSGLAGITFTHASVRRWLPCERPVLIKSMLVQVWTRFFFGMSLPVLFCFEMDGKQVALSVLVLCFTTSMSQCEKCMKMSVFE